MELLCLDFMNSDVRDYLGGGRRTDRLRDPEWLASFLSRWGLGDPGTPGRAVAADLQALRSAMWRVVEAMVEERASGGEDLATVDAALAAAPLRRRLVHDGGGVQVRLEPARRDWAWIASEVAASFGELLSAHDAHRLKLCGNPDCRWVFYDESKNRTRRWCADSCGNLIKVRRFRKARR